MFAPFVLTLLCKKGDHYFISDNENNESGAKSDIFWWQNQTQNILEGVIILTKILMLHLAISSCYFPPHPEYFFFSVNMKTLTNDYLT